MPVRIRRYLPMCIILAQDLPHLPQPNSTAERMVATCWDHQQCQALAAAGGCQGQALYCW